MDLSPFPPPRERFPTIRLAIPACNASLVVLFLMHVLYRGRLT